MKTAAHLFAIAAALLALTPGLWGQTAPTVTTLYSFVDTSDGFPAAALVQGSDGNFYGTAIGGHGSYGTVFSITPAGVHNTLHTFIGTDGSNTLAALVQGSDGNFYGTTYGGGGTNGTVFSITSAGAFTLLYSFSGGADGADPYGALVQGSDGNFYGMADGGGGSNDGTVFSITSAGVLTTLHSFTGNDGENPTATLVQGSDGNFYGTTSYGGSSNDGTVFSITSAGVLTTLHSFTGNDGELPYTALVQGRDGNFYGTTSKGGNSNDGTVFSITPAGVFTTLYSFTGGADGQYPQASLAQGRDGNFYGTTNGNYAGFGGSNDSFGTIFSITPAGVLTTLHSFTGAGTDGQYPIGALILGRDGNFYGTTEEGGSFDDGTVFKLTLPPYGALQFASASVNTTENAGNVSLSVQRTGGSAGAVVVSYSETDGTALAGRDYQATTGTLSWADGDTSARTITVPINNNGTSGGTVSFTVILSNPSGGATLGTIPTATVSIADNDATPAPGTPTPAPGTTPTATLLFPPDNLTVPIGVPLTLVASLSDPAGTAVSVQFVADATSIGAPISVAPGANYTVAYTPPTTGFFEISAVVTDNAGHQETTASVGLNIIAPPAGEAVGGITFLGGLDQRVLAAGSSVNLAAQLSAASSAGVSSVTFYADNQQIAAFDGSGAPLTSGRAPGNRPVRRDAASGDAVYQSSYQLPVENKLVNLIATLLTEDGLSVSSAPVTLTVKLAQTPPGITLDDPTANGGVAARVGQDVTVTAKALSSLPIARVQYYVGTQKVADVINPTVYAFDFMPTATGNTVLTAVVTDTSGLSAGSPPLTLNVLSAAPTVTLTGGGAVVEGTKGVIVVSRSGDTNAALTVSYKAKGAAVAGVDYKKLSGTITIPAGAAKAKIKVKPQAGLTGAGTLKLKLMLVAPSDGSYTVGTGTVKLKLIGND